MNIDWSLMKTAEQKAEDAAMAERSANNAKALAFLAETDWYVTRLHETGAAIPEDVKAARAEARASIVTS